MLLNYVRQHWLCFLIGGVIGYAMHWCPLLGHNHDVCPRHNACSCEDCACDVCTCGVDCKNGCACKG